MQPKLEQITDKKMMESVDNDKEADIDGLTYDEVLNIGISVKLPCHDS